MDYIVISGVRPYNGRYAFDIEGRPFTTREWGWIKRLSGYLPMTVAQGFQDVDPELICAFAVVCLHRDGKIETRDVQDVFDRLQDAPFETSLTVESDTADVEGDDPFVESIPENSPANTPTSGTDSQTSSETSPDILPTSGTPVSDISESRRTA